MCLGPPGGWSWPLARLSGGVFVPDAGQRASPATRLHRVTRARPFLLALVLIGTAEAPPLFAQSTAGSVFGTIRDEQLAVVAGADITLVDMQTGRARAMRSGATGGYRFFGLTPGRYSLRVERPGFLTEPVPNITLHVGQQLQVDATLVVAGLAGTITVEPQPAVETTTTLARTVRRAEIDHLPAQDRGYTNLALLAPGVQENRTNPGSSAAVVTAGQTGRNDTFLLDGFSLDYSALGSVWGDVPIDSISEFGVLTSGFGAEFGQASGAIVTIVTRSGSNQLAGRAYHYHRDHALDARPAASDLLGPSATPASFEQKTPGGYVGGPIARDHAFFFASAEGSLTDSQHVVSSSVLHVFRPNAPAIVPTRDDKWKAFGRVDVNTRSDELMFQYRFHQESMANRFGQVDLQLGAPERAGPASGWAQEAAFADTHVLSATRLNDFRLQAGRLGFLLDTNCPACAAENRPSIRLGGNPSLPNRQDERRLQLLDTFTWSPGRTAPWDHTLKLGADVSLLTTHWHGLVNRYGTFLYGTDRPFDPVDPATYPLRYTRTIGTPALTLPHQTYAVFVQDQWRPARSVTLNVGLRWDRAVLENGPFGAGDLAPRLGAAFAPGSGRTVVRASYGRYIDQVPLAVVAAATQAVSAAQITIFNPGYPDPLGPNPRRSTAPVAITPNVTTLADELPAPFTDQGALGLVRQLGRLGALSADFVLARGHRLLVTHDLNYPDLTDPSRPRPDPRFQQILQVQSTGRSWFRAMQVQLVRRESHGYAYSVAYTWSSAERDTEDWDFVPQDQRDYAADRGPSASDVPHQVVASFDADLPIGLRLATVATGRSGVPYNITTGVDSNRDGNFNDRPPGVSRNSARESSFWQIDLRLSKQFRTGRYALELLAEALNVLNRRNWTGYVGDQSSILFGRPTDADIARQVQLGVRVGF